MSHIVCIQYYHGDATFVMYQNVPGGMGHFSTVSYHYYYFLDRQVKSSVHLHLAFLYEHLQPQPQNF